MISISEEFKRAQPQVAEFCGIINQALEERPDMTLAEFAKIIESVHREMRYERIVEAERKQFGTIGDEKYVTNQETGNRRALQSL